MEENKVVAQVATDIVEGANGNLKVVGITVAVTLTMAIAGTFAVKKCKKAIENRKNKPEFVKA